MRVLSKESVTGDPRENERAREAGNPDAAFKGTLNNTFTPARQEEIISGGISGVDNFLDIAQQSDRGSLDYHPLFTPGELINMNGIYMNNHEALNYLWGASMSELGSKNGLEVTPGMALDGAGIYNVYDFFSGDSRTIFNQGNHREAIVRGYLDSRNGVSTSKDRDIEVNWTMFLTDAAGWY